jgi:hypothetical protein
MDIKEEHKELLRKLGLTDQDFELFDGKQVRYEYEAEKGARIYDPYYDTSYNEYIGIDGWSAWSSEKDTFMSDILEGVAELIQTRTVHSPACYDQETSKALQKKVGNKTDSEQ